jgi:hypothetical protein
MAGRGRRKCKCCQHLFCPDPRNRHHQQYCSQEACRVASKAASQARWCSQPGNQDYFRGAAAVERVRAWRAGHPGYSRKGPRCGAALQDVLLAQTIESTDKRGDSARPPLQEVLSAQPAVLMGLIAHIVGSPLQDDIAVAAGRLLRLGTDILTISGVPAPLAWPAIAGSREPSRIAGDGGSRDRLRDVLQNPRLP